MPGYHISSAAFYPYSGKENLRITRGQGIHLYDEGGKQYIDALGAAAILGHGREDVAEVLRQQAVHVALTPTQYFGTHVLEEYVAAITDFAPMEMNYAWTVSGGTEAVEDAIKLARQHHYLRGEPQRYKVIGRWQSYHGSTVGALDVGGVTGRRKMFTPLMRQHPHIPAADCYRCPFATTPASCELECAAALEKLIRQEGAETVAAFIAEPVVSAALSAVPAPKGYFQRIREICDEYGVLLILDEVMTGFGRSGKNFAIEHWEVTPDIIAAAKGISGGYFPLGAVIAHDRVVRPLLEQGQSFAGSHTYAGNPLGAAVGLYVLNYIKSHHLVERARMLGERFLQKLNSLLSLDIVGNVCGMGLLAGIELVIDKANKQPWPAHLEVSRRIGEEALKRGLITFAGRGSVDGVAGDYIGLAPPLIIQEHQLDEIVAILRGAIVAVSDELHL